MPAPPGVAGRLHYPHPSLLIVPSEACLPASEGIETIQEITLGPHPNQPPQPPCGFRMGPFGNVLRWAALELFLHAPNRGRPTFKKIWEVSPVCNTLGCLFLFSLMLLSLLLVFASGFHILLVVTGVIILMGLAIIAILALIEYNNR